MFIIICTKVGRQVLCCVSLLPTYHLLRIGIEKVKV